MFTKSPTSRKQYRAGAIGALLDVYENAIGQLQQTIADIPEEALTIIADNQTTDLDCVSVQTILSHVVHSGYGYATNIRNQKGTPVTRPEKTPRFTINEYRNDLQLVFTFTAETLNRFTDDELEQKEPALKILTGWGQLYDIEQLMEHAITHILRHNRQIEKIKHTLSL